MIRSKCLAGLMGILTLFPGPAPAAGGEFRFSKPVPVRSILETLEAVGQFNVILCSGIDGTATFSITDVSPKEALRIFVMSQGLRIHPVENSGGRETFLVGTEEQIAAITQTRAMQVVTLRFQEAARLEEILKDVLATSGVKIRSVAPHNMLILEGPSSGLRKAVEILTYLDLPVPTVHFQVTVSQGPTELWRTDLETRSGHGVEAVIGSVPAGDRKQPWLTVALSPRVNKDGFLFVESQVKMSATEPGQNPASGVDRVTTSAQIKAGEPLTLASFRRGDGPALEVKLDAKIGEIAVMPALEPSEILNNFPKLPEIDIDEEVAASASPAPSPAPEIEVDLDSIDLTPGATGEGGAAPPVRLPPPVDPGEPGSLEEDLPVIDELPGVPGDDLLDSPFEDDPYPRVLPPDEE